LKIDDEKVETKRAKDFGMKVEAYILFYRRVGNNKEKRKVQKKRNYQKKGDNIKPLEETKVQKRRTKV